MTGPGELLQFALLAGFLMAVTLGLLIAACALPLRRLLAVSTPARRARMAWWLLATPALVGLAYAGLTVGMPTLLHDSARFAAACSAHSGHFWHLCLWHPTGHGQNAWLWAALMLVGAYAAWLAVRAAAALWRHRQELLVLLRLARRRGRTDRLRVLDSDQPMALACGTGRGHILLSTALLEQLTPTQLRVVLAHEQAHVAHRDVLCRLVAALLSAIQLPGTRRWLLGELDLALEQRCDLAAASAVGSRLVVADTIVAVERAFRRHASRPTPALAKAFLSGFVAERVQALLAPASDTAHWPGRLVAVTLGGFCVLSAGWLHHVTESFVALLAG